MVGTSKTVPPKSCKRKTGNAKTSYNRTEGKKNY
jgi:hypothetical protein